MPFISPKLKAKIFHPQTREDMYNSLCITVKVAKRNERLPLEKTQQRTAVSMGIRERTAVRIQGEDEVGNSEVNSLHSFRTPNKTLRTATETLTGLHDFDFYVVQQCTRFLYDYEGCTNS
jgi:hypothetical protein